MGTSKRRHPASIKPSGRGSDLIKTKSAMPQKEWLVTNSYKMALIGKLRSHPMFNKERRRQIFEDFPMLNEGNHNRTLLLLFLILVYCQTSLTKSPSMLRGGLVYQEKITQGPVYVNVESITLFRLTYPSILVESMQTLRSIANLYQKVCCDRR